MNIIELQRITSGIVTNLLKRDYESVTITLDNPTHITLYLNNKPITFKRDIFMPNIEVDVVDSSFSEEEIRKVLRRVRKELGTLFNLNILYEQLDEEKTVKCK